MFKKLLAMLRVAFPIKPTTVTLLKEVGPIYFIGVKDGAAPTRGHNSYPAALREAVRLSNLTGKPARIYIQAAYVSQSFTGVRVDQYDSFEPLRFDWAGVQTHGLDTDALRHRLLTERTYEH